MKLFSTPYYCPKCKEKLNLQWDFDPSNQYWKCVECGTWLEHGSEKEEYKIFKGKKPGDTPVPEQTFDSGDMDDDFYETPSSAESREYGKKVESPAIAPFAVDAEVKEEEERAKEAADKYHSVVEEEFDEYDDVVLPVDEKVQERKEREPDPTRKKGWTWPFGKKKAETIDPEDGFVEAEIPEEVTDVDWDAEMAHQKGASVAEEPALKKPARLKKTLKHLFKHRKIYATLLAIIAALLVGFTIYHHMQKMVVTGVSDEQAKSMSYEEVIDILEKNGYTTIEAIPLEDLQSKNMDKENIVDMISIGGDTDFTDNDRFEYDSEVVIQYHSAKMIKMPLDPKKVKEKSVQELENLLQKAGFEKITVEPHYDLILGVLHKEGDVEKITVNGSEKFTELQSYRIDTEIVITYHDFKKNNTKK